MSYYTVYVCDCCGNQSPTQSNFNALPGTLSKYFNVLNGTLVCNQCITSLFLSSDSPLTARAGINANVMMAKVGA